ncbi:MAG: segregation/condensation protein A [Pseudomonadales bacterium]|nr:segregation/condensation protein A [Pseudomonadales bacterium]
MITEQNIVPLEEPIQPPNKEQVQAELLAKIPDDLYIPPDALEVILDTFEGPLDLLLYLIRRKNLDILNIPVAQITVQYIQYIDVMQNFRFDLAGEYLVMAAMLAEIKSRMLIPRESEIEDEEDPRAELVRRLQEYERFKQAAEDIDELPRMHRDTFSVSAELPEMDHQQPVPEVELREMLLALANVIARADKFTHHQIHMEPLSTRERMTHILVKLSEIDGGFLPFVALFTIEEGRLGVVVSFLALLELIKDSLVEIVQTEDEGHIHVKARSGASAALSSIENSEKVSGSTTPDDSASQATLF